MLSFENMNPIATNMYPIPCRDWKGYDSSIHYLDKIYWVELGYIPFHYPDMRIQINWYHLVDLQGNKREF